MSEKEDSGISWVGWLALILIIGVIVAIAIPSYGDYTLRSQVSEAISLMGGARTPLSEYFSGHKKWPGKLEDVTEATKGKYTASVAITKGAASSSSEIELTATMRSGEVSASVAGHTSRMISKDGGRTWSCHPGTMPPKYLPLTCRD